MLGSTVRSVGSRVPDEWRAPIAFAVVWIVPFVVAIARPSFWARVDGHGYIGVALSFALFVVLIGALLQRSRAAWWIFVLIYLGNFVQSGRHIASHGLGTTWVVYGVLGLVNFALLISAPMRRFVGLRGRLAPGPR